MTKVTTTITVYGQPVEYVGKIHIIGGEEGTLCGRGWTPTRVDVASEDYEAIVHKYIIPSDDPDATANQIFCKACFWNKRAAY